MNISSIHNRDLRQLAERHGVNCLQSGDLPCEEDTAVFARTLQQRELAVTSVLQSILAQPTQFQNARWYD
jgi:hypothetical protein